MRKLTVDARARALIFDVDGTLANSMPVHYTAWKKTFDKYGIAFTLEKFYELAGAPSPVITSILLGKQVVDGESIAMAEEKEKNYLELIHTIKPLTPVTDLARSYRGVLPLGAGTGSPRNVAEITIDVLGLTGFFHAIVSYEDVVNPKPAPDTFLKCSQLLKVEPQYCHVFEDGDLGLQAAKNAGMISTDVRPFL